MSKKFQYPDKFNTKVPDGPPVGGYDIEKADKITKPEPKAALIKEPLNLYTKPESVRPEATDAHAKPFGADVKGKVTMGSKFPADVKKAAPEPKNIDYDKILKATKPRAPAASMNGSVLMADGTTASMHPDIAAIPTMTREQKIALLMELEQRPSIPVDRFRTPSKSTSLRRPMTSVVKKGMTPAKFRPSSPAKPRPSSPMKMQASLRN